MISSEQTTTAVAKVSNHSKKSLFKRRKKCLDDEDVHDKIVKTRKIEDSCNTSKKNSGPLSDMSNVMTRSRKNMMEKVKHTDVSKTLVTRHREKFKKHGLFSRKTNAQEPNISLKLPVPKSIPKDEEMEVSFTPVSFPSSFTCRPAEVPDIDTGDHFSCPEYAQDIISFSQVAERKWLVETNFMEDGLINKHMRAVLTDWLLQVQVHLSLLETTLHLSVAVIDKYIVKKGIEINKMQLLGVTALFVAAKFYERFPPEIKILTHLTDETYTYEDIIQMERSILTIMEFDFNYPTPTFFLDRFLMIEKNGTEMKVMCQYLLDLLLLSAEVCTYPSSLRAASSLFIAGLLLQYPKIKNPWTLSQAYYTRYSENQLLSCARFMALSTENVRKYQGAYVKYSSYSKFLAISQHESLKPYIINKVVRAISGQNVVIDVASPRCE